MLVVKDESIRSALRKNIHESGQFAILSETNDYRIAISEEKIARPDIVIVDLNVNDLFESIQALRKTFPICKILVLSKNIDSQLILGSFQAGASAYLEGQNIPDRIVEKLNELAHGIKITPEISREIVKSFYLKKTGTLVEDDREFLNEFVKS